MGRKADFNKKKKLGPGRKAKKQQPPKFSTLHEEKDETSFSSNQKKRAKKRALKAEEKVEQKVKKQKCDAKEEEASVAKEAPKKLLFASDSENESDPELPSDSDDDGLSFEKKAKKLIAEEEQRDEDNLRELQSFEEKVCIDIPPLQDVEKQLEEGPDFDTLKSWIKDIAYVLSDLKNRNNGRSRSELIQILKICLCSHYSYNEFLLNKLMGLFTISDFLDFLEANEAPRPVTLRTNSLKARRKDLLKALLNQGVDVQTLNWSDVGLIVYKSNIAIGATVEYFTGQYMIQGASSYLSVMALDPQPNEIILDLCAAPGGKSTHIAAAMKNSGMLCSNDISKERTKALIGNFHRMGVKNAVITNMDGRKIGNKMPNRFNRSLLDAPCSGTGVISKDPSVKGSKTDTDIQTFTLKQKQLLLSAIDAVNARSKAGGYIVYSTCSLLVEENEFVVDYAIRERNVACVPIDVEIGKQGFLNYIGKSFHKSIKNCRRIYPHLHNMDGFFVALLKKFS